MISTVEYFTGNGASGQQGKVLIQVPFTEKETEAEGSSLPFLPAPSSFHSLLISCMFNLLITHKAGNVPRTHTGGMFTYTEDIQPEHPTCKTNS